MNHRNSMTEVSVEELINQFDLIVPEIQREYVWGNNDFHILDTFIEDIKEGYTAYLEARKKLSPEYEMLHKMYESTEDLTQKSHLSKLLEGAMPTQSMNIGFLYSYKPDHYIANDRVTDLYLIDGQQRFTTLFLTLFYFAVKEERLSDFFRIFKFDKDREHIAFDYRVRTLTHNFIIDLLNNTRSINDLMTIKSQNWFLSDYKNDVTVQSIIGRANAPLSKTGVFNILHNAFNADSSNYFNFIKGNIKFWHFKTESTSQGEELYITMNARGQQLADNETIRAKLFETDIAKNNQIEWSEKWEEWQDFFWKHRNKSNKEATADKGFNEFLRWVQIIEMTEQWIKNPKVLKRETIENLIKGEGSKNIHFQFLNLISIEQCFEAINYLYTQFKNNFTLFNQIYPNYRNFDLLNSEWLKPEKDAISQIDCFALLPIVLFCKLQKPYGSDDSQNLFRIIRFFFNLTKNDSIAKTAAARCVDALILVKNLSSKDICTVLNQSNVSAMILSNEEKQKLRFYKELEIEAEVNANERFLLEDAFWKAEDIDVNKGEIEHLIKLAFKETKKNNNDFIAEFNLITTTFSEFIANDDIVWGNTITSDIYNFWYDRIYYEEGWHRKDSYLDMILRKKNSGNNLTDFIINEQKSFIRQYETPSTLFSETSPQKQLYLYYIIHRQFLKDWNWHWGYNFGVFQKADTFDWETYPAALFKNGLVFKFYKEKRMRNDKYLLVGHYESFHSKKDYLQELIDWANG